MSIIDDVAIEQVLTESPVESSYTPTYLPVVNKNKQKKSCKGEILLGVFMMIVLLGATAYVLFVISR